MYVCLLSFLKSNLLEASPELMKRDSEKEWYYGNKEKERLGPFSFEEVSTTKSIFFALVSSNLLTNEIQDMSSLK